MDDKVDEKVLKVLRPFFKKYDMLFGKKFWRHMRATTPKTQNDDIG